MLEGPQFDLLGTVRMADAPGADPFVPGDWFQLAKVGTFHSPVYGKINISPDDLATMFRNFKTKTPLPPTQLPIDYDHLSDEPKQPEDGKAAGWVQDLQPRDGGNTLWCKPKWTRRAAELIANGEYRFVSPYFLVDYLDKASGKRIGPTLKAVAITNRPFLEGMEPIPAPAIAASDTAVRQDNVAPVPAPEAGVMPAPEAWQARGARSAPAEQPRALSELAAARQKFIAPRQDE